MTIRKQALSAIAAFFAGLFLFCTLLPAGPAAATEAGNAEIRLTMIPHRSALGNMKAYGKLIAALEKASGYTIRWVGAKTYQEVIDNLRGKKADIGYVGAFAYIEAQDDFGVRLIARTLDKKRRAFYQSLIITRSDSAIKSLRDLKGKVFAFTDPGSTSGFLFPMVALTKTGLRLEDFSDVKYVKRHANSIMAVVNRQADAGAMSSTAREKVDIDFGQIRILWESDPIYRGPWIAAKEMPDESFYRIQKALITISDDDNAAEIFKELGTKGFVLGKDSDYDNVREVYRLMNSSRVKNETRSLQR